MNAIFTIYVSLFSKIYGIRSTWESFSNLYRKEGVVYLFNG